MRTPHINLRPPSNADIAALEAALRRSGRPYTDDDLLAVMSWLAQTELSQTWLEMARGGRAALVVEDGYVRLVANASDPAATTGGN